ncbi:hypothetical protein BJX99DRAFT_41147 [Aspergillus californicus]
MSQRQRRSHVRRANVTACMRCKSRKQRCDQNLPACMNCMSAGVECVNVDLDRLVTPRSYIKSLEDRVAHLEKHLVAHGITDYDLQPPVSTRSVRDIPTRSPISTSEATPLRITGTGVPDLLLAPVGHLATSNVSSNSNGDHRKLLDDLPYEAKTALPSREAAGTLSDAYFEHSDFFSPILIRSEISLTIDLLYMDGNDMSSVPSQDRFRVMLVFAISIRLLNRKDASFPVARSEAYYHLVTRILSANPDLIQTTGLDQLSNLALLTQYMFFSSNLVSAWYLLGFATRMVIEMDIHQDQGHDQGAATNRRRWSFWTIYSFERILCNVLNRPYSIPDEAIYTSLPTMDENEFRRCHAIHFISHRRLSSEIQQTISQKPAINGARLDYITWRDNMRYRLQEWRSNAPENDSPSQLAPIETFDGSYHNSVVLLYLPWPKTPPIDNFGVALLAQSAARTVELYKVSFRDGKLRFYWRTIHHIFRAGIALVLCLVAIPGTPSIGDLTMADLKNSISTCSAILWGMVERHHSGQWYRDMFENISSSVENVSDFPSLQNRCHRLLESILSPVINMPSAPESQPSYRDNFQNVASPVVDDSNPLQTFIDMFTSTDEFGLYNIE